MAMNQNRLPTAGTYCTGALLAITFSTAALSAAGPVTFVKTYANIILNTTQQKDVTPVGMQATSDGGYILLASTDCTTEACIAAQGNTNPLVNWLVKTDSAGNPQWQKEVGCFSASADNTMGLSVQQTADGGYVVGGGEYNYESCGSGRVQRAIVEKLDSRGNLTWSKTYPTGSNGDGIAAIKQAADGGYVAVGGVYEVGPSPGVGLVLKLDASGEVQWQHTIGPGGSTTVVLNAVQPTFDGGYVTTGNYYTFSPRCQPFQCEYGLVVKLDEDGNVQWQDSLNSETSSMWTDSVVQTSDGRYVTAGEWFGASQKGGLLVKLDSNGNVVWQNAYSGGNFFGAEQGVGIYSVHQTADGGYFLAGAGEDELLPDDALVPWLGKVDSNGNLLWEHFYYQVDNGLSLSEYFAGSDAAKDGGYIAAGWTEDYSKGLGLLFVVKTDGSGQCGSCGDVHPDEGLTVVNPGLTISPPSMPVGTTATEGANSPGKTRLTSVTIKKDC